MISRKSMQVTLIIPATMLVGVLFLLLSYAKWQLFDRTDRLSPSLVAKLDSLGKEAVATEDVPVSSLLIYGQQVIGEGYNTVKRTGNIGAHAEINAISDAIQRIGIDRFSSLDRDSLSLVSTFEPCPMCRSAILEYRIHHVQFLKPKPISYLLFEDLRVIRYEWERTHKEPASLQDSLFSLYPSSRK